MIDVHSHVLPNVDDGSDSVQASLLLLREEVKNGVDKVILTPHYKLGSYEVSKEKLFSAFNSFKDEVKSANIPVELYLGQEIYVGDNFYESLSSGDVVTINGTKNILIEFNYYIECDILMHAHKIVSLGYTPVIAHIERYTYFDFSNLYDLRRIGALIQTNASSVVGKAGSKIKNLVLDAIRNNLVDFVASDIHKGRKPYMQKAFKKVSKLIGEDGANRLFSSNAKNLIK